jgi:hypothetical protein
MPNLFANLFNPAKTKQPVPEHLWALCVMKLNVGDVRSMSPEELTQFLDHQAAQASADTQTLYTCELDGQRVLPLFSTSEGAGQFSQIMYKNRKQDSPETTIMAFTMIRMTRAAVASKLRSNQSLLPILNPATSEERRLSQGDLDQKC